MSDSTFICRDRFPEREFVVAAVIVAVSIAKLTAATISMFVDSTNNAVDCFFPCKAGYVLSLIKLTERRTSQT